MLGEEELQAQRPATQQAEPSRSGPRIGMRDSGGLSQEFLCLTWPGCKHLTVADKMASLFQLLYLRTLEKANLITWLHHQTPSWSQVQDGGWSPNHGPGPTCIPDPSSLFRLYFLGPATPKLEALANFPFWIFFFFFSFFSFGTGD